MKLISKYKTYYHQSIVLAETLRTPQPVTKEYKLILSEQENI